MTVTYTTLTRKQMQAKINFERDVLDCPYYVYGLVDVEHTGRLRKLVADHLGYKYHDLPKGMVAEYRHLFEKTLIEGNTSGTS